MIRRLELLVSLVVLLALCSSSLSPAPTRTGFVLLESNYTMMGLSYKALLFIPHKAAILLLPFITEARKTLCLDIV